MADLEVKRQQETYNMREVRFIHLAHSDSFCIANRLREN